MLFIYGRWLYRFRWAVIGLALVLTVGAGIYGAGVFGVLQGTNIQDPTSESARAAQTLATHFGAAAPQLVVLLRSDTLVATDAAFAQATRQLAATLSGRPEVASVTSYDTTHDPSLVSQDAHATIMLVQLSRAQSSSAAYQALKPLLTSPTLQVEAGGGVVSDAQFNDQIGHDLLHAEEISLPLVAVFLILVFGSLVAAALPLLIGIIAILTAFALVHGIATVTDISSFVINVVTFLGLGLAIDYALLIVTRFREELHTDAADVRAALLRTLATAGRTVLFSGLTVSLCLATLLLFPEVLLRSMGVGALAATLAALVISLTVLPAILALVGKRINALAIRRVQLGVGAEQQGFWYRLARGVMRFPLPIALGVVALLALLGAPFLHATFSTPDERLLPATASARIVATQLRQDFPGNDDATVTIAIHTPGDALSAPNLALLAGYVQSLTLVPDVKQVTSLVTVDSRLTLSDYQRLYSDPAANPAIAAAATALAADDVTQVRVTLAAADRTPLAQRLVHDLRAVPAPPGFARAVGGTTAQAVDVFASLRNTIPIALGWMAVAMFVLLFLMTGSLVMPLKTIVVNTLSLTATFGALVWIFQDGHLQSMLDFQSVGSLDSTQPVLIFALAFGLSMDYEVFLLSRIKEEYDRTGDNRAAVATGLQRTGGLITSAAFLLAVVVGAFATARIIFIQEIGVGVALAVVMDATLVRGLLVPAIMRLMGRWNWWAPRPLRRLWERIGLTESPPSAA